jgi:hypothetical protein
MTRVSEIAENWLGLCRKPPAVHALQAGTGIPPEPLYEGQPAGGGGGSGAIRRGIGAILSGTKTLTHNPQLLWFTFLAGLVLTGHLFAQWVLLFVNFNGRLVTTDLIGSPFVAFLVELPTVFCLVFLLAGLALSLTSKSDGSVSFFDGFTRAKKFLIPLTGWSVVLALAGTLLFTAGSNPGNLKSSWSLWSPFSTFLLYVLNQYPFSWTLNPAVFGALTYPPWGEFCGAGFPDAFIDTLIFSVINTLLFILTLFVVPQLVLEKKRLKEAVSGSFVLMKNLRGEVAACVLGLGMVVSAALFTFLLFRFTRIDQVTILYNGGITISSLRPGDAWIAFGFLYILALSGFLLVVTTIGGIATLDLYTSAKTRESAE